jgi:predicted nucleic acid-binding protein
VEQQEELVPEAEELLDSYQRNETGFVVPDIFWLELGNVLWTAVRRETISAENAMSALTSVRDLEIPTVPSFDLVPQALSYGLKYRRTVYDCLYVALAVQSKNDLITADERLANALAAHLPVKWLGAL